MSHVEQMLYQCSHDSSYDLVSTICLTSSAFLTTLSIESKWCLLVTVQRFRCCLTADMFILHHIQLYYSNTESNCSILTKKYWMPGRHTADFHNFCLLQLLWDWFECFLQNLCIVFRGLNDLWFEKLFFIYATFYKYLFLWQNLKLNCFVIIFLEVMKNQEDAYTMENTSLQQLYSELVTKYEQNKTSESGLRLQIHNAKKVQVDLKCKSIYNYLWCIGKICSFPNTILVIKC